MDATLGTRFYDETDVIFDGADITEASCRPPSPDAKNVVVKDLGSVTADAIEMRLMFSEGTDNEDLEVAFLLLEVR